MLFYTNSVFVVLRVEQMQYFYFEETNVRTKHRIHNLHTKCNTSFNIGVTNPYNIKILVASSTIKVRIF